MKKNLIHSISVWLAIFMLSLLAACRSSEDAVDPESTEVGLYLNIAPFVESRTDMSTLLDDNEKMKSLRVVVLHDSGNDSGKVEHNKFYNLLREEQGNKLVILKVKRNEKKKIFLFANEESVTKVEFQPSDEEVVTNQEDEATNLTSFFNKYKEEGDDKGFETAVNNLYFEPKYTDETAIPMSSMYEVDAMPQGGYDKKDLYVVRVATKFTVKFENWRTTKVKVNSFSISNHADKNFLMAHVNSYPNQGEKDPAWKWINWMTTAISEESSENDTKAAGWLKDYDLPKAATHTKTYEKKDITVSAWSPSKEGPGTPGEGPTMYFYLPESKNIEEGATEQEYTMTIKINVDGERTEKTFEFKLPNPEAPNLEALFRNTHVVINILIKDNIELKVDLHPYTSVILEPMFGIDYNGNNENNENEEN